EVPRLGRPPRQQRLGEGFRRRGSDRGAARHQPVRPGDGPVQQPLNAIPRNPVSWRNRVSKRTPISKARGGTTAGFVLFMRAPGGVFPRPRRFPPSCSPPPPLKRESPHPRRPAGGLHSPPPILPRGSHA